MNQTFKSLRKLVRRNEMTRRLFRGLYRVSKYQLARVVALFRTDDLGIIYVDPNAIETTVRPDDPSWTATGVMHLGSVEPGDWDRGGLPVRSLGHVFTILSKRIRTGLDFEAIPEFQENLAKIEAGDLVDGSQSLAEYRARWEQIEALYWQIKENGYLTQEDLGSGYSLDEVKIQVGRAGELVFEEGIHRLAIAQFLDLDQIPVIITRRHAEWEDLRQSVLKIVLQRGFIHQPFNHPDLDILPQKFGNELKDRALYGHERWDYILDSLPLDRGTVLDIGSYFGYFVHRFENLGFTCYAVEPDQENLAVLHRYRAMQGKQFTIWEKSIFDIEQSDFDVVLALNIFHHLVKTKNDYERLTTFLNKLKCKAMYFEPQEVQEGHKKMADAEFIAYVLNHTGLTQARRLGRTREGRDLYLLTAS